MLLFQIPEVVQEVIGRVQILESQTDQIAHFTFSRVVAL
jgi:hypothetical protein